MLSPLVEEKCDLFPGWLSIIIRSIIILFIVGTERGKGFSINIKIPV